MTYLTKPRRIVRRRSPPPMSGFFDWLIGSPSETIQTLYSVGDGIRECVDGANAIVASFDAKIDDLVKNWNPSGFYTPADIRGFVQSTMAMVQSGQAAIDQAAQGESAAQESILRATDDLARAGGRSIEYLQAAAEADQQGIRVINAPGFKRWITDTMAAASSAVVTASVIACMKPWWANVLSVFQIAFDRVWSTAKLFLGAVLAIGEVALKVANDLPDLYSILRWGALAAGAYLVYVRYLKQNP